MEQSDRQATPPHSPSLEVKHRIVYTPRKRRYILTRAVELKEEWQPRKEALYLGMICQSYNTYYKTIEEPLLTVNSFRTTFFSWVREREEVLDHLGSTGTDNEDSGDTRLLDELVLEDELMKRQKEDRARRKMLLKQSQELGKTVRDELGSQIPSSPLSSPDAVLATNGTDGEQNTEPTLQSDGFADVGASDTAATEATTPGGPSAPNKRRRTVRRNRLNEEPDKYGQSIDEVVSILSRFESTYEEVVNVKLQSAGKMDRLANDTKEVKADITDVRTELKTDISNVKTELQTDISDVKTELKAIGSAIRNLTVHFLPNDIQNNEINKN